MVVALSEVMGIISNSMVTAKTLHLLISSSYVHNNRITIDSLKNIVLDDLHDEYQINNVCHISVFVSIIIHDCIERGGDQRCERIGQST